jgi:nickel-dependent lactate racemase
MNITLQYGKKGLSLQLPNDWDVTVIRKKRMPVLSDPQAALESALANPVASSSLFEAAKGSASACILICDNTRPVPNVWSCGS